MPDRSFSDVLRRAYNKQIAEVYDEVRDFILLHYILARRDEPFWREARNAPMPDTLAEKIALYDETGRIETGTRQLFPETSYFFIFEGNGRLPRRLIVEAEIAGPGNVWQLLDRIRAENRESAARMPSHKSYLAELHRATF